MGRLRSTHWKTMTTYRILMVKSEGKKTLRRPRLGGKIILK
jgi:hypothetical protein